jgi:hypothetical protein
MAPVHRLAIELSDQSKDTIAQYKRIVMNERRSRNQRTTAKRFSSTSCIMRETPVGSAHAPLLYVGW